MKEFKILGLSLLSVFSPIEPILITGCVLVLSDLVLGLLASKKRGETIRYSNACRRSLTKFMVYELAIALAFLAGKMTGPLLPLTNLVSSYVGLTELISCLENLNCLAGGSLLTTILGKLGALKTEQDVAETKE